MTDVDQAIVEFRIKELALAYSVGENFSNYTAEDVVKKAKIIEAFIRGDKVD